VDRRGFLVTTGVLGTAMTTAGAYTVKATPAPTETGLGPLFDRQRASEFMRRADLEALLLTLPLNVYHTTGAIPGASRYTQVNMTAALVPADLTRPVAYLASGFEYYISVSHTGLYDGVEPYVTGGSLGDPDTRSSPAFAMIGNYPFDAREQHRRLLTEHAAPFQENLGVALTKALKARSLGGHTIGCDSSDARALLQSANAHTAWRPADDLMLHIRSVKTPAELALMRTAAEANVDAALTTARAARQEGSLLNIRQRFFAEAAKHGNVPVCGSVDLVMDERADGQLREGQAFMIDFVSHHSFYQGDYGRTIFFGEPDKQMRYAADTGIKAWAEVRSHLRPGLRFSEIRQIGNDTVRKLGAPFSYAFNPHTVGLQHWDQPRLSVDGKPLDLPLEAGMVLSVDCHLLNAGVNGTTHLEDLILITASGSEPIHRTGDNIVIV
jgi:Xaa-Pro aminopeptidase